MSDKGEKDHAQLADALVAVEEKFQKELATVAHMDDSTERAIRRERYLETILAWDS